MILVLGAGMTGLTTALLLARDGHDVTVLERDPAPPPPPGSAWTDWERAGVAQFRQLHVLLPRWREVMEAELPDVPAAVLAAGGLRTNGLHFRPVAATGGWRAGDERFDLVTARRPVAEAALAAVAADATGIRIRRGVEVTGLVLEDDRVVGVRTEDGPVTADLVVDAGGRRSRVPAWLAAAGARPPAEERADSGFVYHSRHYRYHSQHRRSAEVPVAIEAMLTHYASASVITLPADNGTWAVGLITSSRDRALHGLRDPVRFEAALRCYPATEPWLQGEPITGVTAMGGIEDRRRDHSGGPAGLVAVGDSAAATNPSLGRGISIGAIQARVLRDVVAKEGTPSALVERYAVECAATVAPYVDSTLFFDRHRLAEIDAEVAGVPYEPADPRWLMTRALGAGAREDPALARAHALIGGVQATPPELLADPALLARVRTYVGRSHHAPGATRAELLAAIA
jgi:2-polyprenyl-6-methoxyphenol hydroxylase-like FAD-dependent oxidoreductase